MWFGEHLPGFNQRSVVVFIPGNLFTVFGYFSWSCCCCSSSSSCSCCWLFGEEINTWFVCLFFFFWSCSCWHTFIFKAFCLPFCFRFRFTVFVFFISSGSMDSVLRGYSKLIFNTTKLVFFRKRSFFHFSKIFIMKICGKTSFCVYEFCDWLIDWSSVYVYVLSMCLCVCVCGTRICILLILIFFSFLFFVVFLLDKCKNSFRFRWDDYKYG